LCGLSTIEISMTGTMAYDALVTKLEDQSSDAREAAAIALGRYGDVRATEPLTRSLGDPEPGVRVCAAVALAKLGWSPSNAEERGNFEVAFDELQAAATAGEPAVRPLFEELAQAIGLDWPERSTLAAADEPSPTKEEEEITAALLNCLDDADPGVRLSATKSLASLGDPAHAPHFMALLSDNDFEIRLAAIDFVSRMNDPQVAGSLSPKLADVHPQVRRAAATALGATLNPAGIEDLVVALVDEDPSVRATVTEALEKINPYWAASKEAQRAQSRLQLLLTDSRPRVGAAAAQLLSHLRASAP
jgi:HEAT repeat protein